MLDVAYLHYGSQSGVTPQIAGALRSRGHSVTTLLVPGPLEPRDENGRVHPSFPFAFSLAVAARRFGRQAYGHRWNTPYAFDIHTRRADGLIADLPKPPDIVLQNGALFSPCLHLRRYVLLLDHTHALSLKQTPAPEAGLAPAFDYGPGWRARETALYRGARAIATLSRETAQSLRRDYGVPPERIHVVGGGANVFPPNVRRHDDGQTLLFIGKDFRRKGGIVLLRAFERLRTVRPGLKLIIAGPHTLHALPAGVESVGLVPVSEVPELCARSTIFVLPTLREPYGLAFLDAMACGLPCIGTNIEAVPEVVEHDSSGLLVPAGDDAALANAIATLLDDPERARLMGEHGRRLVATDFLWTHVGARLEEVLRIASAPDADREAPRATVA